VFRKTLRDGGASITALLDDIDADMDALIDENQEQILPMASRVRTSTACARDAISHLLASANTPRKAAASGHHFIMMMGMLTGGWQMVRGAAMAIKQSKEQGADVDFLTTRWTLADVFVTQRMPQADALAETIMTGDEAVLSVAAELLAAEA
jgi:hypothetical protein